MAEIKGAIPGPNLTLDPMERGLNDWLAAARRRFGDQHFVIRELHIDPTAGVWGDVAIGIRAAGYSAWEERVREFVEGDIKAQRWHRNKKTGEITGEICIHIRVA